MQQSSSVKIGPNMNSEHITRFEISNFKKFDHLVVENMGLVNLITGDNNVGKTCLLEALTLKPSMKSIISMLGLSLFNRNFQFDNQQRFDTNAPEANQANNIIGMSQRNLNQPITVRGDNSEGILFQFSVENKIINVVETENDEIRHFAKNLTRYPGINLYSKNWLLFYNHHENNKATYEKGNDLEYMVDLTSSYYGGFFGYEKRDNLITLNDFYKNDLIEIYELVTIKPRAKKHLIDTINIIFVDFQISDIDKRVNLGKHHLMFSVQGEDNWYPITQFGDGFVRTLRILLELMYRQSPRIMIDEVEVGIHFQKMKREWDTIFKLATETNTQVFATTHSLDCIKAFIEAGAENDAIKNELRLIELEEFTVKDGTVKQVATTFTHEVLKYKVEADTNVLGGNVWK